MGWFSILQGEFGIPTPDLLRASEAQRALRSEKSIPIENCNPGSKFSIPIEIFNLDRKFQSPSFYLRGPRSVQRRARSKISIHDRSLEIFNPEGRDQIFSIPGPSGGSYRYGPRCD